MMILTSLMNLIRGALILISPSCCLIFINLSFIMLPPFIVGIVRLKKIIDVVCTYLQDFICIICKNSENIV